MRPTNYNEEVLQATRDYVDAYANGQGNRSVPTIVELSRLIKRSKSTVYEWIGHSDKAEFADLVSQIEDLQHEVLVDGGLAGGFNPAVTKMMLTKHGYSDKQEIDLHATADVTPWADIGTGEDE